MICGNWETEDDVWRAFEVDPQPVTILFASYHDQDWEGYALVVLNGADGRLYSVHGSYCSCMGLEGQWAPEPETYSALHVFAAERTSTYDSDVWSDLREWLATLDEA